MKLYSSGDNLLKVFKPLNQALIARDKDRAYMGVSPTLTSIKLTFGSKYVNLFMMSQLENLNDFVGVSNKIQTQTMIELSEMIAVKYHYLKAAEILLFFYNFKMGTYGELYGSVDPLKITSALNKFIFQRFEDIGRIERENKKLTEPIQSQSGNILTGLEQLKEINQKAKTDYKTFRVLFPKLPTDKADLVYWRAWRMFEKSVGAYLCEFNIENR